MVRLLCLLGSLLAAAPALTAHPSPPNQGQFPPQEPTPGPNPNQTSRPDPVEPTPFPTPPVDFHDGTHGGFDGSADYDQNRGFKPENGPDAGSGQSAASAAPSVHAVGAKSKLKSPAPQATPDFEALGALLDRISRDRKALSQILAGRSTLDQLGAGDRAAGRIHPG